MNEITRTIYGGELQVCSTHGIAYPVTKNTTLNEALKILQDIQLAEGEYPQFQYLVVGSGGHTLSATAEGVPKVTRRRHDPSDASPYAIRPFVLRPETNDLTKEQRSRYGLRRSEIHNDKRYFAYYALRLDLTNTKTEKLLVTKRNGETTIKPFIPDSENLEPTPKFISPNSAFPTLKDGNYYTVSAVTIVDFTPWEIKEYIDAIKIIDRDEDLAVISEFCLVTAVNRDVTVEGTGGAQIAFRELGAAQVMQFVTTYEHLAFTNESAQFILDAGVTEDAITSSGPQ